MHKKIIFLIAVIVMTAAAHVHAQDLKTRVNDNKTLDSLRKLEEEGKDSVVFNSKYIRYTTLALTKDSIQTVPLDTTLNGFHNFNVLIQPRRPTVGTGNLGLPAMPLLFEPLKTIGFDAGFHTLDFYSLTHDDIKYYQARTPFTSLYYVSAGEVEQVFRIIHSQNIKPNWNIGANFNRIGANGFYRHQRGDDLNGALFTWYQSPSKRYNLWSSAVFNTLKVQENGSTPNDSIFTDASFAVDRQAERIRLSSARRIWRQSSVMLKQTYFVGRIDSLRQEVSSKILPTNRIAYTFKYNANSYAFQKDEADDRTVIPVGRVDSVFTNDSTRYSNVQNEFIYSFFLRAKSSSIIKNELKVNAGIRHDYYNYSQGAFDKAATKYYNYDASFQNTTLLGSAGYRFSNRIDLSVDLQQIFQGRNTGDFLYEAKSNVLLSKSAGRIVLGAYFQNKSPEQNYIRYYSNHYEWVKNFDRTKTINFSFRYLNDKFGIETSGDYFLITNYLYFIADPARGSTYILPEQLNQSLNLLKITLAKKISFGKFNLDSYVVYQKTDNPGKLRTPEIYTFNSLYIDNTFFKVLKTNVGLDVRYNTPYLNYSYSPAAGQFYIGAVERKFNTEPIIDIWVKASLRRANLFVKCDYINQGLGIFSKGYYTVDRYPMPDRQLFKFGVQWNFYD
ncbi:putative porin [Pedobacter faecalis]|uniref:putative porin n=1 Tax=Pedobacter faecalis TaxID=3041495 RepID=UPI00254FE5BA|nr:putative porin [Pedobacter sp. ELA7]